MRCINSIPAIVIAALAKPFKPSIVAIHGAQGEGTDNAYFPRLAGKPGGYLANQLHAFHTGRRHYPPMNYLLA
jgi:cytochrome c553